MSGYVYEEMLRDSFPQMNLLLLDSEADIIQSLLSNKCDAILLDGHALKYHTEKIPEITILDEPFKSTHLGVAFAKEETELLAEFNKFFEQIKADGTYDDMHTRWLENSHQATMPNLQLPTEGEPIRIATNATAPPLVFILDGELAGFDIEMGIRFGQYLQRPVEWGNMNFTGIIPSLASGKYNMAISSIIISEKRAESVNFSTPYLKCDGLIGVRNENSAKNATVTDNTEKRGPLESFAKAFYRNIIEEDRYIMILDGIKTTVLISLLSVIFGTILGGIVCWMNMRKKGFFKVFAKVYISILRGTPVLVLLLIMFYVVFAKVSIDAITVSVITFGMNFAAYVSEMFRSSIESIDRGQTEAGIALGFSPTQTFINIVMPQAIKQVMPIYKGEVISLVKMTSIVGYIAVQDMTKVGDIIRSRTFDAFFPLILIAVLYFIISWLFVLLLDFIGKKIIKN